MADKDQSSSHGEKTIIAIVGILLLVKAIDKAWIWMKLSPRHFGSDSSESYSLDEVSKGQR